MMQHMSRKRKHTMGNLINLVLGDISHDGHGFTETITIDSNLTKEQLIKAHNAGAKELKIDLGNDVARDYEDNVIEKRTWKKLIKAGMTRNDLYAIEQSTPWVQRDKQYDEMWNEHIGAIEEVNETELDPFTFAAIWLFIAKVGDDTLSFKVSHNESPNINIGGYGLFT